MPIKSSQNRPISSHHFEEPKKCRILPEEPTDTILMSEVVVVLEVEVVLENSLLDSAVVDDNLPC